ncbi:MAG TPA: helix-hairpin-helix domain-containing protein [Gemmatimonadales bacterium]|nr:helix-hairpin-helix domain-containing protein [Gemmatimonadales bacterium]
MQPRTAALLLLLTAVGGQALLRLRPTSGAAPGAVAFHLGDTTSLAGQRAHAATRTAEVGPGEVIDVDQASAGELARLPGVGPGLAKRIVAERARKGAFGGSACLDARVPGVGEAFLRRAGPHLRYSGTECRQEVASETRHGALGARSGGGGCTEPVDLNGAGRAELDCLPGIGPARADAILAFRERRGGFRSVDELREVPGVSTMLFEGLRTRVTVGRAP